MAASGSLNPSQVTQQLKDSLRPASALMLVSEATGQMFLRLALCWGRSDNASSVTSLLTGLVRTSLRKTKKKDKKKTQRDPVYLNKARGADFYWSEI